MATYRDYALADYQARLDTEAGAEQLAKDELVSRARTALIPMFTDSADKLVLDPTTKTVANLVDLEHGLVVLTTNDGSNVSFGVYPDLPAVHMTTLVDGAWTRGPNVHDLDDVGEYLATGKVGD